MNKRFLELDSLRGLAALSVLFSHFLNVFPWILDTQITNGTVIVNILKYTPLHILWAGHESVIFFFILSGFVLSLPFYKDEPVFYPSFLIKRICRIYIPYFVALIFALAVNYLFYKGGIKELSSWVNLVGQSKVDVSLIAKHFILIGSYKNDIYNPVLWSLVYEMRISIIFPIVIYLVKRFNWRTNVFISLALTVIGVSGNILSEKLFKIGTDYFMTFHYIGMFIIGAMLARNREVLIKKFCGLRRKAKVSFLLLAILLYTNNWWFYLIKPLRGRIFHYVPVNDWGTVVGVVIFIIVALSVKAASNFLHMPPIAYLGKISYSLYLYHAVCLIALINIAYNTYPLWLILVIAFITTIIFASISYYVVEVKSIDLGKHLSKRIQRINVGKADNVESHSN